MNHLKEIARLKAELAREREHNAALQAHIDHINVSIQGAFRTARDSINCIEELTDTLRPLTPQPMSIARDAA